MTFVPDIEEINLVVDFNELEGDSLSTYLEFSRGPWKPREGDWARLTDGEGSSCLGYVKRIEGDMVEVLPDWTTWLPEQSHWAWTPPAQTVRATSLYEALRRLHERPEEASDLIEESSTPSPKEQERSRLVVDQA